jgi:translation initiation factor IF-2
MAHTVKTLSKILRKTPNEVIEILLNAGVDNKNIDSEISAQERKILTNNLSKRFDASDKYVSRNNLKSKTGANSSINIQIKKKSNEDNISQKNTLDEEEIIKAKLSIESGKAAYEKLSNQEAKRIDSILIKKEQEQKEEIKKTIEKKPEIIEDTAKETKKPKHLRNNQKEELNTENENIEEHQLNQKFKSDFSKKIEKERAQHSFQKPAEKIVHEVLVASTIKITDLAQKMKTKVGEVLKTLMKMGVVSNLNDVIDQETALLVVEEMGHKGIAGKQENIEDTLLEQDYETGEKIPRCPVLTVMGHVDHGKTSLLDYIRKSKVASSESGGITQHISAYQVKHKDSIMTFIDTPGHAAFEKMRDRSANITDIVILVVAADDGVMPQTIESIKYAKQAEVPVIVAINKIDKEGVAIDKIQQELSSYGLVSEDWGGDVIIVGVSAHTGEGIDELLEAVNLTTEILELSAPVDSSVKGVVLEARLDKGRGKVATILVQSGTLKKGDIIIAGFEYGKVKQITDYTGKPIKTATPSMPVEVLGLSGVPNAGDKIAAVKSERKAHEVTDFRKTKNRDKELQKKKVSTTDNLLKKMEEADIITVNILLKTDVRGSSQALITALEKLSNDEVKTKVIFSGVGDINNTDIVLASTANALVIGFNVRTDAIARKTAIFEGLEIKCYSIIYDLIDDVKAVIKSKLNPIFSKQMIGAATVKDIFNLQKMGCVAGCIVEEGIIKKGKQLRILRDKKMIFEGELESLRRFKDDVNEVKSGTECGIVIAKYNDVQIGDRIEVFDSIESKRS